MSEFVKALWQLPDNLVSYNRANAILAVAGIFTNAFLQLRFYRNRKQIQISSVPLLHVSICDILLLTTVAISCIALEIRKELPWEWCQVNGYMIVQTIVPSSLSYSIISIDRYKQIILGQTTTPKELVLMIVMVWAVGAVMATIPLLTRIFFVPQASRVYCLGEMFGQTIGHRISAIVSAMSILAGCLTIAVSYYFIHKKAASDGFKWRSHTFLSADQEYATDSGTKNPTAVATGVADYKATSKKTSESLGKFTENDAYMKQLQLTLKLVFLTVYFWSTWFTALASFVYQMISKQNVSPELDFALTMVANSASVINPLLVLSMDSRWRIKFPLQMCRKRKTEISEY